MKPKKSAKLSKKDEAWQKRVEERAKAENLKLDHPKGKERFERALKRLGKKKN